MKTYQICGGSAPLTTLQADGYYYEQGYFYFFTEEVIDSPHPDLGGKNKVLTSCFHEDVVDSILEVQNDWY